MPSFAVEVYTTGLGRSDLEALGARIQAASQDVVLEGQGVRFLESIFFPADELCLHLFEGPSAEAVGRTSERAGLVAERVVEAVRSRGR